jgi:hypothetical protein
VRKEVKMGDHERLRTVGDRVFCCECGKELDIAFLEGKNSVKKPSDNPGPDKTPAKKTRAKKAV